MATVNAYDRINYGEFKLPSLQELMVAPAYLTEQHDLINDAFVANQALAADAATRFQPGIDDTAIQANQEFQSAVNNDINELSKNGLTPNIKRRLVQRKIDFTNNILPFNKAAIDREQWAKAAKEAQLKDPSLIIRNPLSVSLDQWISDPESRDLHPISGQEIYERTRQEMIPISKYISQNIPQLAKTGIPYQYFTIAQAGATAEDIASLMGSQYKDIDSRLLSPLAKLIKNAADKVVTSTGVYDYYGIDSEEANRANAYAASAFNTALGTKSFGSMSDRYNMEMDLLRTKLAAASSGQTTDSVYPNIRAFDYNQVGDTKEGKEIDKKLKHLRQLKSRNINLSKEEILNRIATLDKQVIIPESSALDRTSRVQFPIKSRHVSDELDIYNDYLDLVNTYDTTNIDALITKLEDERNALVQRYKFYSPDLTSSERITEIMRDYFATQTDAEVPILDKEYQPNNNLFGKARTIGYDGKLTPEEFFNSNTKYQFSPAYGIVATNGENKAILSPDMLGATFSNNYAQAMELMNAILQEKYPGYEKDLSKLSMGLVNSIKNEQAILNPIISKTSSKASE